MATLYELTEEYRQLLEMMEDDTVDPEVLQDTLEGVDGEIEAKADNCAKLIRELNGVTSVINEEIERLKARKDVISNNADRVKKYLEKAMIDTGKRKFKTALFGFNIQLVRLPVLQIGRSTGCGFLDILRRILSGKSKRRLMLPTRRCLSCTTR
ncbi:siphovirus Gp157 family protein [Dorea longicatena]|uniref:siphovirus Gp157 family protein n=1 Tax=Dorea longicatena TaxID=88431 RepID=UPI0015D2F3DE|nr:siphovirus Gp157 family protein [Dorea longicatena]NSE39942.1 siphovirus Gp157 family protein [Dorea longicatena]